MASKSPNLREIFAEVDSRLNDPQASDRRTLCERMKAELKGVEWVAAMPNLVEKIAELLNIELPSLLTDFWKTSDQIRHALEESRSEPGKTIFLDLIEHELEGTLHPEIEVTVEVAGLHKKFPLSFDLVLHCTLHGVELGIRQGEIISIGAGSCEVKGTLEYKKLVLARAPRAGAQSISLGLELDVAG